MNITKRISTGLILFGLLVWTVTVAGSYTLSAVSVEWAGLTGTASGIPKEMATGFITGLASIIAGLFARTKGL